MLGFIGRRLATVIVTVFAVSVVAFALLHLTPGDPASVAAGEDASPEQVAETAARLGLDRPIVEQFWSWLTGLMHGDFGESFVQQRPVLDMIIEALPVTLSLVVMSMLVALLISIPLGTFAALRHGTLADRLALTGSSLGIAMPDFFLGVLLVLTLALGVGIFPATGFVAIEDNPGLWFVHLVLPAITLGTGVAAELTRHIRASLSDVLDLDYVRTAKAKGLGKYSVVIKHAARNAAMPVVTVLGNQVNRLLGGTVIVEKVFAMPGLGTLVVDSVFQRDLPVVLGIGVFVAFAVLIVNAIIDISYGWLNPKVRG